MSSAPDEGSTFTLLLPRPPDPEVHEVAPAADGVTHDALTGQGADATHRTPPQPERSTR